MLTMTTHAIRLIAVLSLAAATVFSGCALAGPSAGDAAPTTGAVSGTITGADGDGAAGLDVSIGRGGHVTRTDENGLFRVSGLRPGTYTVTVSRDGKTLQRKTGVKVESRHTSYLDFQVAGAPFLQENLSLIILVAAGVICIVASVAIKRAINRAKEDRGEAVERSAAG
jgi:hypothetical protein